MMQAPLPLTRDLVLIGGGHTHALVLRKWGMNPLPGARLTLINPGPSAPYTGMLPGFVAGHYAREDLAIDLVKLARFAGARLIFGAVNAIEPKARLIQLPDRAPIAYDIASINIGITSELPQLAGFAEHAVAAKPLGPYALKWVNYREKLAAEAGPARIAVLGGGIGGVELAMAMAHALRDHLDAGITLIERADALPGIGNRARQVLLSQLNQMGVNLIENAEAVDIGADAVRLSDGQVIAADFTVGAAGARAHSWLENTGLALDQGFIKVDRELRSSDPAIFAAGDCAALPDPRPKAGVFAVREAPVLYHNLRASLDLG